MLTGIAPRRKKYTACPVVSTDMIELFLLSTGQSTPASAMFSTTTFDSHLSTAVPPVFCGA